MFGLPRSTFVLCIAVFVLLGAFSRFTHGAYTPWFHNYQEYHQADDGSSLAKIVPIGDLVLGISALYPRTRFFALAIIDIFTAFGLVIQMLAGKRFEVDALTVLLATLAVIEAS